MKWNVFLQDSQTGKFKPYNIFDNQDFRLSAENLFKKQYPTLIHRINSWRGCWNV